MRWKIYYDDATTFSSEDGTWEQAPSDGVLFVVEWQGDRTLIMSGQDYYFLHDGALGFTGDLGPLIRKLGFVKYGRWTSHARMERAAEHVRRDTSAS